MWQGSQNPFMKGKKRNKIKNYLAGGMINIFKKLVKIRRIKRKLVWKICAKRVSEDDLIKDLVSSNLLRPGDIVMIHSSLSSIGKVIGGPQAVCHAFQKVLTEKGTLLMPSYYQPEPILKMIKKGTLVDLRTAESNMGEITETFRTLPGVKRSSHPFSSVCAWGRYSNEILSDHAHSPYICGPGSPFFQLIERSGKYMGIGIDIRVIALYHVLEENWNKFPIRVHYPESFKIQYVDSRGELIRRELIILDPEVSKTRIDQEVEGAWIRRWLTNYMRTQGVLREFKLGHATSWIVDAKDFYDQLRFLAQRGITIYTTKKEFEARGEEEILRD
jgi:aminoglycoside 3-N-acetyltransferase